MFIKSNYVDASEQGIAGLAIAISWFSNNGYFVSLPIADLRPYDLVIEKNNILYKVQVKTTIVKHEVGIKRKKTYYKVSSKKYKRNAFDYYFIATPEENYFFPKKEVSSSTKRTYLTKRFDKYKAIYG